MKYYIISPLLFGLLLLSGCRNKNVFESSGYTVKIAEDSSLNIWLGKVHMVISPAARGDSNFIGTFFQLNDPSKVDLFSVDRKTGNWMFCQSNNQYICNGKMLIFDQYQAVTAISWLHEGGLFLTCNHSGGVFFEDIKKVRIDHILPPHIIFSKVSDSSYHFIIEQNTYPVVWCDVIIKSHNKVTDSKSDIISNTREFYVSQDSLPIRLRIDYGLGDSYKVGDRKIVKSFQWSSATDSVTEVKVN